MSMVKGSCLCGGVRFEADEVAMITHCHCSMCRKAGGGAFGTFANVVPEKFRYLAGEDLIATYQSSPDNQRGFCRTCGSIVPVLSPDRVSVVIAAGTLDDDPGVRPVLHIFCGSKAPWWEIPDDLPHFDEWVPGYDAEGRREE